MIQTKSEYENIVIKLLETAISGENLSVEHFPECTEKDFSEILYQCITDGFIIGFSVIRTADGNPSFQRVGTPYVTIKGLSFIDSVNQARALNIAQRAEKISISAKLKAKISFFISGATFVATLIINADKIVHNVRAILSYLSTLQ